MGLGKQTYKTRRNFKREKSIVGAPMNSINHSPPKLIIQSDHYGEMYLCTCTCVFTVYPFGDTIRRCGRICIRPYNPAIFQVGRKSNFLKGAGSLMLWMYVSAHILAYVCTIIIRVSSRGAEQRTLVMEKTLTRRARPPGPMCGLGRPEFVRYSVPSYVGNYRPCSDGRAYKMMAVEERSSSDASRDWLSRIQGVFSFLFLTDFRAKGATPVKVKVASSASSQN